jgi:hypothetical protein
LIQPVRCLSLLRNRNDVECTDIDQEKLIPDYFHAFRTEERIGDWGHTRVVMKTLDGGVSTVQFATFTRVALTFPPVGTKPAYV